MLRLGRLLFFVFGVTWLGVSHATVMCEVTWGIHVGNLTSPGTYRGTGDTQEHAVEVARQICTRAQVVGTAKYSCLNDPKQVKCNTLPGGTYLKSCQDNKRGCRMEGDVLVCPFCKPVLEDRRLDMKNCPGDRYNKVENFHGDLRC